MGISCESCQGYGFRRSQVGPKIPHFQQAAEGCCLLVWDHIITQYPASPSALPPLYQQEEDVLPFMVSVMHYWTPFFLPFIQPQNIVLLFFSLASCFCSGKKKSIQKIKYDMQNNPLSPLEGSSSLDFQSSRTFLLWLTTALITISKYYLQGLRIYIGGRVHRKKKNKQPHFFLFYFQIDIHPLHCPRTPLSPSLHTTQLLNPV